MISLTSQFSCNQYLIINIKIKLKISILPIRVSVVTKDHDISNFTKKAYSKQITAQIVCVVICSCDMYTLKNLIKHILRRDIRLVIESIQRVRCLLCPISLAIYWKTLVESM